MPISNPIPDRLARVVDADEGDLDAIGPSWRKDVFVTAAEDIEGLSADELSHRLGIPPAKYYTVMEFSLKSIQGSVMSPITEAVQCFVGRGRTRGGARESVIQNQPIPQSATLREVY